MVGSETRAAVTVEHNDLFAVATGSFLARTSLTGPKTYNGFRGTKKELVLYYLPGKLNVFPVSEHMLQLIIPSSCDV